jgi:hypothetical protein
MNVIQTEGRINRDDLIQACHGVLAMDAQTPTIAGRDSPVWFGFDWGPGKDYGSAVDVGTAIAEPPAFIARDMFGGGGK